MLFWSVLENCLNSERVAWKMLLLAFLGGEMCFFAAVPFELLRRTGNRLQGLWNVSEILVGPSPYTYVAAIDKKLSVVLAFVDQ